jgi:hypothetical protein
MGKLILISQAVSLSVIFYVVVYFLIIWQWPETLLSVFVCTFILYFLIRERAYAVDPVAAIAPDHTPPQT